MCTDELAVTVQPPQPTPRRTAGTSTGQHEASPEDRLPTGSTRFGNASPMTTTCRIHGVARKDVISMLAKAHQTLRRHLPPSRQPGSARTADVRPVPVSTLGALVRRDVACVRPAVKHEDDQGRQ